MNKPFKSDRQVALAQQWARIGAGHVANTSAPFRKESERQSGKWHAFFDRSPDFWAFLGTAIVTVSLGLLAVWVAL